MIKTGFKVRFLFSFFTSGYIALTANDLFKKQLIFIARDLEAKLKVVLVYREMWLVMIFFFLQESLSNQTNNDQTIQWSLKRLIDKVEEQRSEFMI